jgi:hypothetical protein
MSKQSRRLLTPFSLCVDCVPVNEIPLARIFFFYQKEKVGWGGVETVVPFSVAEDKWVAQIAGAGQGR